MIRIIHEHLWKNLPAGVRDVARIVLPSTVQRRYGGQYGGYKIVSFPKCGRTWLVIMLGQTLKAHYGIHNRTPVELNKFWEENVSAPMVTWSHDDLPMFKTPERLERRKSYHKKNKIIFLVRDPRDVVVSLYFQFIKRDSARHLSKVPNSPSELIYPPFRTFETIIEFYNIWCRQPWITDDNFMLVRYEDMMSGSADVLARIISFMNLKGVDPALIDEAVEYSSFSKLKEKEKNNEFDSPILSTKEKDDPDSYKVRRGVVGGYEDYIGEEDVAYMNSMIKERLDRRLGYL